MKEGIKPHPNPLSPQEKVWCGECNVYLSVVRDLSMMCMTPWCSIGQMQRANSKKSDALVAGSKYLREEE